VVWVNWRNLLSAVKQALQLEPVKAEEAAGGDNYIGGEAPSRL
jgi:hypothetical protein